MEIEQFLKEKFAMDYFREGQKEIIRDLLNKHNVFAMLPTGSGKSLCYQLPALMLDGITIVVSPLLSLMEDQVTQLKMKGHKQVVAINSFLTSEERKYVLHHLKNYKLIYVSPEILQNEHIVHQLMKLPVSLFVVDEAHCISQWGHDFRTDYLKLSEVREKFGNPPCLAITATATLEVQADIMKLLNIDTFKKHIYSSNRPNIAMVVQQVPLHKGTKIEQLVQLVSSLQGPGVIYASTRGQTEELASQLRKVGSHKVAYYHGGMSNEDRQLIQQQFLNHELSLICCTSAFGMGINKHDIRFVIHYHFPAQLESYLQEIGRAGRDGKPSIAITLYSKEEQSLQRSLIQSELPTKRQVSDVLNYLQFNQIATLSNETLITIGISETIWRYIQYHLEKLGMIYKGKYNAHANVNRIIRYFQKEVQERLHYKETKLAQFVAWLENRHHCRRKKVMDYFDDDSCVHTDACCDICGIDIHRYQSNDVILIDKKFQSWQIQLKNIFHQ